MKISKNRLSRIIKEELARLLLESEEERFESLTRLLTAPSEENWKALLILLKNWEIGPDRDNIIDHVEEELDSWPDEKREFIPGRFYRTNKRMPEVFLNPTKKYAYYSRLAKHIPNRTDLSMTVERAAELINSPHMENITILGIELQRPNDEGGIALANAIDDSDYLQNLVELRIPATRLGDEAARILANSTKLPNLEKLNLNHNHIGLSGRRVLWNSRVLRNTEIIMSDSQLYPIGRTEIDAPEELFVGRDGAKHYAPILKMIKEIED